MFYSPSTIHAQVDLCKVLCSSELLSFPGSCVTSGGVFVVKISDSGLCFQNSCVEEIYCVSDHEDMGGLQSVLRGQGSQHKNLYQV